MNLTVVSAVAPYVLWILGALVISAFGVVKPYHALSIFVIAILLSLFGSVDWSIVAFNFPMLVAVVGILFATVGLLVACSASCFGYGFSFRDLPRFRFN